MRIDLWLIINLRVVSVLTQLRLSSLATGLMLGLSSPTLQAYSSSDIFDMTLEELTQIKVTTPTKGKAYQINQSPGIITRISREEIYNSGARDLIDVLRQIPGINIGLDLAGVFSIGMRGIWAQEGKVLLLLDGHELNEDLFSGFALGDHLPIDLVDHIEVIRGPGSAIYGGNAELGVINIRTRGASEEMGHATFASLNYGQAESELGHTTVSGSHSFTAPHYSFSLSTFFGQGLYSDEVFTGRTGATVELDNSNAKSKPRYLSAQYKAGDLTINLMADHYSHSDALGSGEPRQTTNLSFKSEHALIQYQWQLSSKVQVQPKLQLKHEKPWRSPTRNQTVKKWKAGVDTYFEPTETWALQFGVEHYQLDLTGAEAQTTDYKDTALYLSSTYQHPIGNFTLGGRYEDHSESDEVFVPRFAYTKQWESLHLKALVSKAFRVPSAGTLTSSSGNARLEPEKTFVTELEFGYKFQQNLLVIVDLFQTKLEDPIIFVSRENNQSGYSNESQTGSKGIEVTSKFKFGHSDFDFAYAYHKPSKNEIDIYASPDNDAFIAFPQNTISASINHALNPNITFNSRVSYKSKRWANFPTSTNSGIEDNLQETDSQLIWNANINFDHFRNKGLRLRVSMFNLTDEDYQYIQANRGVHPPISGGSREVLLRIQYEI